MRIDSANISMTSQHTATTRQETRESLRMWVGEPPGRQPRETTTVQISPAGQAAENAEAQAAASAADAVANDPVLGVIMRMIEMMTGHRIRVFDAGDLRAGAAAPETPAPHARRQDAPPPRAAGFGIEYDYHAVREETEQTSFTAEGVVRTADGREIRFQLDLSMSRQYYEETNFSLRAGDAVRKDPLVINFGGTAAQLSDRRFAFDLDADGQGEQIATLAPGSGYLALDLNGNGQIDSGAELFGPATGNGFGELAALDEDGNGWIDEGDKAFNQLRVWTPDAEGAGTLATLQERQVGALYLGRVATPFDIRGTDNADLGAVAATGLYLSEAGEAGTLQEIDLTV